MIVKVCGITRVEDALVCVDAGAGAIGLNFVAGSPRRIDVDRAASVARAVRGRARVIGVVAGETEETMRRLLDSAGLDALQLHGDEPPELVARLGDRAFKAVRVGTRRDVFAAARFEGRLLVDARVEGTLGGTGKTVDLELAREIAATRPIWLAGGLTPENVAAAIAFVRPEGVDVASGVESSPGIKDAAKVRSFIERARAAAA